jgi:peptidyl-prolyl cis-trans isomerase B (cyclophilin B)
MTAKTYTAPPAVTIDLKKKYTATLKTDRGDLVLELFVTDAPKTVNNFVFLAREGFYDNTVFHRVISDFMAQGGDPTGTGRGGPGYRFADEISSQKHSAGVLSMANAGPNTNGSQFFITHLPQPHLNGKHTVFGKLKDPLNGMEVLLKIKQGDKLIKATIEEQ